jgi:hypothetical protein
MSSIFMIFVVCFFALVFFYEGWWGICSVEISLVRDGIAGEVGELDWVVFRVRWMVDLRVSIDVRGSEMPFSDVWGDVLGRVVFASVSPWSI